MGLFDRFKSAQNEQNQMAQEQAKIDKETKDAKIRRNIDVDREVMENQKKRLRKRTFRDKVISARSQLAMQKDRLRNNLLMEYNAFEQLQKQNRPMELLKAKQRVKKAYYYLIIINRFEERLYDIEDNHMWKMAVGDLRMTMKVMNKVSTGTDKIKNVLYRIQVKKLETVSVDSTSQPFGTELLKPIDMLVSDEIFNLLHADNSEEAIEKYILENCAVLLQPEEVMSEVKNSKASNDPDSVAQVFKDDDEEDDSYANTNDEDDEAEFMDTMSRFG